MKKNILILFFALFSLNCFGQSQIEAKELTKKELKNSKGRRLLKNKSRVMPKEA